MKETKVTKITHDRKIFLTTPDLDLVLIEKTDVDQILKWFRDSEVNQFLNGGEFPITDKHEEDYIDKMYKTENKLQLGVYHRIDKKLIGTVGIHKINNVHLEGIFGIAIGEKTYWNKGIGTQTLKAMLDWAFYQRGLHTVRLDVLSNNPRAKRCYEKYGFKTIGLVPNSVFKQGRWYDRVLMYIKSSNL